MKLWIEIRMAVVLMVVAGCASEPVRVPIASVQAPIAPAPMTEEEKNALKWVITDAGQGKMPVCHDDTCVVMTLTRPGQKKPDMFLVLLRRQERMILTRFNLDRIEQLNGKELVYSRDKDNPALRVLVVQAADCIDYWRRYFPAPGGIAFCFEKL